MTIQKVSSESVKVMSDSDFFFQFKKNAVLTDYKTISLGNYFIIYLGCFILLIVS